MHEVVDKRNKNDTTVLYCSLLKDIRIMLVTQYYVYQSLFLSAIRT